MVSSSKTKTKYITPIQILLINILLLFLTFSIPLPGWVWEPEWQSGILGYEAEETDLPDEGSRHDHVHVAPRRRALRHGNLFPTVTGRKLVRVELAGVTSHSRSSNHFGAGRSSEVERSLIVRWVVGSILHGVDPLSYFSFQPVLHD